MRRVATKSLKAYGAGVVVLEKLMQEVLQETMEIISSKDGETVDTYQLSYGYVGCVMVSIVSYMRKIVGHRTIAICLILYLRLAEQANYSIPGGSSPGVVSIS